MLLLVAQERLLVTSGCPGEVACYFWLPRRECLLLLVAQGRLLVTNGCPGEVACYFWLSRRGCLLLLVAQERMLVTSGWTVTQTIKNTLKKMADSYANPSRNTSS